MFDCFNRQSPNASNEPDLFSLSSITQWGEEIIDNDIDEIMRELYPGNFE